MKDIVRGKNAEKFWPASVTAKGYSGEQRTGGGAIFEFVPITPGGKSSLAVDFVPSKHTPKTPALPCSIVHGARVQPAKAEKIFRRLISDGRNSVDALSAFDPKQTKSGRLFNCRLKCQLY